MKLPISKRLLLCAELVPPCETVADVGTDHGYLAIHLLQTGKCAHVIASDLREKPLASAKANAAKAFPLGGRCPSAHTGADEGKAFPLGGRCPSAHTGADEGKAFPSGGRCPSAHTGADEGSPDESRISFVQSDGLHKIAPGSFDVLVLAGMGGDLIARILDDAPWLDGGDYTLILQPQSAANELRRRLGEKGWSIRRERLVRDGGFLYAVLAVRPGQGRALTPGEQYVSPALRREQDPLYPDYLARMRRALELTVQGISQSEDPNDAARAEYYKAALEEVQSLPPGGKVPQCAHWGG